MNKNLLSKSFTFTTGKPSAFRGITAGGKIDNISRTVANSFAFIMTVLSVRASFIGKGGNRSTRRKFQTHG